MDERSTRRGPRVAPGAVKIRVVDQVGSAVKNDERRIVKLRDGLGGAVSRLVFAWVKTIIETIGCRLTTPLEQVVFASAVQGCKGARVEGLTVAAMAGPSHRCTTS